MERDEFLRAAWRVMVAGGIDVHRLVFVDEMGTNTSLSPLYGWAAKGERACWSVPRNRGPNTTLLASINVGGMGPCLAVVGPTTREVFEAYVEQVLARAYGRDRLLLWTTSAPTKVLRSGSSSKRGVADFSTCRPTRLTSIRSKRLSRRSRTSYGKPKLAVARR